MHPFRNLLLAGTAKNSHFDLQKLHYCHGLVGAQDLKPFHTHKTRNNTDIQFTLSTAKDYQTFIMKPDRKWKD